MEYDLEILSDIFDLFLEELKFFSSDFEVQYQRFQRSDITEDLANEFGDIEKERGRILLENGWLTEEQYDIILEIDKKLDSMSTNKNLWDNDALEHSEEWKSCKKMGLELLASLGY